MCLSQGVNEKLCAFPLSVLVTDCNPHIPSLPASSPPPSSPPSTSPQPFWPEGGVITGAVDSAALGFGSLLYWADSLIKHANRIYRTRLNNHSLCKCSVVSDGLSLYSSLFKNLIIRYQLMWTRCSISRWIKFNIYLIDFVETVYVQWCRSLVKGHTSKSVIIITCNIALFKIPLLFSLLLLVWLLDSSGHILSHINSTDIYLFHFHVPTALYLDLQEVW